MSSELHTRLIGPCRRTQSLIPISQSRKTLMTMQKHIVTIFEIAQLRVNKIVPQKSQDLLIENFGTYMHFQQLLFTATLSTLSVMQQIPRGNKFKIRRATISQTTHARLRTTAVPTNFDFEYMDGSGGPGTVSRISLVSENCSGQDRCGPDAG